MRRSARSFHSDPMPRLHPEPASASRRAELPLLGDELDRRLPERPGLRRTREEVDVDPPDASAAELDVAGSAAGIGPRLVATADGRDERLGDDAGGSLREDARLRHT